MTQTPNGPGRTPDQPPSGQRSKWSGKRTSTTRSRMGSAWIASILFAVVLLILLIFILENSQRVKISFFGAHGTLPQGVALLLAAVFGVLLVALPGTARIIQLHLRHRRYRRAMTGAADVQPPAETDTAPTLSSAERGWSPGSPATTGQATGTQPAAPDGSPAETTRGADAENASPPPR